MEREINVREWKNNWVIGAYEDKNLKTQISAGWYDWFCKDTSLYNKTKKMAKIIMKLKNSEKSYVFFKNNCPMNGPLYDSLKICDIENGDVIYCINIDCPYDNYKYTIYGKENNFKTPLYYASSVNDIVKYLNNKEW